MATSVVIYIFKKKMDPRLCGDDKKEPKTKGSFLSFF